MDRNLRQGYLAEQLGAYLLRPFAAVAEVSRPDDVGVDAIATLLKRQGARKLLPEQSLYVQFKAVSVQAVEYSPEQFAWLLDLRVPLFFGRVDVSRASIELFSTHILSRSVHAGDPSHYCLFEFAFEDSLAFGDYDVEGGKKLRLRTGPPILRWSTGDVCKEDFLDLAYQVLKQFVRHENTNFALRPLKAVTWLEWTTNEVPKNLGCAAMGSLRGGPDLADALRKCEAAYQCVLRNSVHAEMTEDDINAHRAMIRYFRKHGLDPDPHNTFEYHTAETVSWLRGQRD
jgi:hypothetical protein